jgi:hypothetical protein
MKRVGIAVALVALALGGCAPAGTDGDLTNGWPSIPAGKPWQPRAGDCYAETRGVVTTPLITAPIGGKLVDCATADHSLETAYVGTFTGPEAAAAQPPAQDSATVRAAWATCEVQSVAYLGGDWRAAYLSLSLVLPPAGTWRRGGRWYRCDLARRTSPMQDAVIVPTGTAKDGLRGTRPLAITCLSMYTDSAGNVAAVSRVGCEGPHQAEFVGIYVAPDGAFPDATAEKALIDAGCDKAVAHYLGFANVADYNNQTVGWWAADGFDAGRWALGDRSVRCFAFAFTSNKALVGSVRGIGNSPARSA